METSKRIILVGALLCSLFAYAQSLDTHLGRAIDYVNKGDYARADREVALVQQWNSEDAHMVHVSEMSNACAYLEHCQSVNLPQAVKDSIASYLVEECGLRVNEISRQGNIAETMRLCALGLRMCEVSAQRHHQNYAVLLIDMSMGYQQQGDIPSALEYAKQSLAVFTDNHLEKNTSYCTIAFLTGGYYIMMGQDYVSAYPYIKEAYDVCERLGGASAHPHYPQMLNTYAKLEGQMGAYYAGLGQHERALEHYLSDLTLCEKAAGRDEQYAVILNNIATEYGDLADYPNALQYNQESLALRKQLFGEQHQEYAAALDNIGGVYLNMGDNAQAFACFDKAREIYERLGIRDGMYAMTLSNLGSVYGEFGDYKRAEDYMLKGMRLRKQLFGEVSVEYANSLNNIATFYLETGDLERARDTNLRALSIFESVYGKDHIESASTMSNLGAVYEDLHEYDLAERYHRQALDIRQRVLGANHTDCAISLNNLGMLHDRKHDYHAALKYYAQALNIYKKHFDERSSHIATTINNIGGVYDALGDYEHAAEYYGKACELFYDLYGEHHPNYVTALSNVGFTYYEMGDYKKAEQYLLRSYDRHKTQFLQSLEFMTESQREKYWESIAFEFEFSIPNLAYDCYQKDSRYTGIAYDNQLFYKGALFQSADAVKRSILESGDDRLIGEWKALNDLRKEMVRLHERDPKSATLAEYEQQAEVLEKHITQSSAVYRNNRQLWETKWQDIRGALKQHQTAIEFASVLRKDGDMMYYALLLRADDEHPHLIPLFEESEVAAVLQATTPDEQYDYNQSGWRLFRSIWSKLLPYLHYGNTIYYAATGVLHQIAIETLPFNATESMASMFHMVRLSSTRELAMHHAPSQRSSAALYGGIYYDLELDDLLAQSESYTSLSIASTRAVVDESMRAGVHYLPGTKREVEAISAILRPNHINTRVYTSGAANEESFKALSGRHTNILHVATHGFYWTDSTAREQRYFSQRMAMPGETTMSIDPLTRSGLLFAGANIALRGHSRELPQNVQDGILTSKEISLLDLRDADLVILSACETGKGEITGEGVFGLQRAFKMAGAQTILMSLWPVDDEATQMMTTEFYRHWIERQENKREAFLHAQKAVRARYPQPKYWAAFILLD